MAEVGASTQKLSTGIAESNSAEVDEGREKHRQQWLNSGGRLAVTYRRTKTGS